jgi:hypothetical protein
MSPPPRADENAPLTERTPARRGWLALGGLLVVLLAGVVFRAHDLGKDCFDEDELYAVRIQGASLHSLGAVVGRDAFHTNHPPLMSVPFLYWNAVFGTDEAHVRALPMLFGVAAIFLTYLLGLRLGGPGTAILAALLLAINPLHVAYSREARQYTIFVTITLAAHLFFLRCLWNGSRGNRLGYCVFAMLDLFTHYFAVPALAAHAIVGFWLALRGTPALRRNAFAALLTLGLAILPFVAWLPGMHAQAAQPTRFHLRSGSAIDILRCLQEVEGLGYGLSAAAVAAGGIAVLLAGISLWTRRHDEFPFGGNDFRPPLPRGAAVVLLVGGIVGALGLYLASPRYILPIADGMLQGYGYDAETITRELVLLRVELTAFPLAAAVCGGVLLAWFPLLRLLERLPCLGQPTDHPLSVAGMVAMLLLVPLLAVRVIALLGIPFLTSRNLMVLAPIASIALALGLDALLRNRAGRVVGAVSLLVLVASACQYGPIASLWAGQGHPIETNDILWRDAAGRLNELPDDAPLLVNNNPSTDPALFYLAGHHPRRVDVGAELPPRFRLIHLEQNLFCKVFLDALKERGATLTFLSQHGTLILYDVRLDEPGNRS